MVGGVGAIVGGAVEGGGGGAVERSGGLDVSGFVESELGSADTSSSAAQALSDPLDVTTGGTERAGQADVAYLTIGPRG